MLELVSLAGGPVPCRVTRHEGAVRRGRHTIGEVLAATADDVATLCGGDAVGTFEGAVFLDTETTGLAGGAGTHVFLLGCASFVDGALEVRQWVLRDPAEEDAFLAAIDHEAARARSVVTFHGGGFDLPRLEERCLLAGRPFPFAGMPHVDLLLGARRVLRLRAGRASLQHLERQVLGVERLDDLPGAECPAAWFAYIRGDTAPMARVLEHNLLDLLSLPPLAAALAAAARGAAPAPDLYSAGRVFRRTGDRDRSLGLHQTAARSAEESGLAAQAHFEAARLLRAKGLAAEAAAEALAATLRDPGLPGPWVELAMLAEHETRDFAFALACARRAEKAMFLRSRSVAARRDLAKRIARLEQRAGGGAATGATGASGAPGATAPGAPGSGAPGSGARDPGAPRSRVPGSHAPDSPT